MTRKARMGLVVAAVAALAVPLAAAPKQGPSLAKGFWRVLVKPQAKWVLKNTTDAKAKDTVVVETYDVRKVGAADVARLRWTHVTRSGKEDIGSSDGGRYTQVAVTDAGLYILTAEADDAAVAAALQKKPSRSDPPRPYEGTKQNKGRFLHVEDGPIVCLGEGPLPDAGDCEDTCEGEMCLSPTAGVVRLSGTWAPGMEIFEASR